MKTLFGLVLFILIATACDSPQQEIISVDPVIESTWSITPVCFNKSIPALQAGSIYGICGELNCQQDIDRAKTLLKGHGLGYDGYVIKIRFKRGGMLLYEWVRIYNAQDVLLHEYCWTVSGGAFPCPN